MNKDVRDAIEFNLLFISVPVAFVVLSLLLDCCNVSF